MPAHHIDDPSFFETVTSESMRWYQAVFDEFDAKGARIVLGDDPWDLTAPGVAILDLPPHSTIQRHAHDCHVVVVVVRGSLDLGDGRVLVPGDIDIHGRGEFYGPYTAGPDGVVTYEFLADNKPNRLIPEDGADAETLAYIDRVHAAEERARAAASDEPSAS